MEKRYITKMAIIARPEVRLRRFAGDDADAAPAGCYRTSTSAGAIVGSRSALALSKRGSFTHSALHP